MIVEEPAAEPQGTGEQPSATHLDGGADGRTSPAARPRLLGLGASRAILELTDGPNVVRHRVLLGSIRGADGVADASARRSGVVRREVVIDGWRFEVEVEDERHAALRERATRVGTQSSPDGAVEIRAIIPGRIVAVSVAAGDQVTMTQQLLVVEAMKMQNELRAPRDGTIDRVAAGVGDHVELGDLLVVLR
jgi:biotin carboxyl carrier protein